MKIGSAIAEMVGQSEVGGVYPEGDSAWWLLQLAAKSPGQYQVAIVLLSCTNWPRKHTFRLVGTPFLTFQAPFSPEECSLVEGP